MRNADTMTTDTTVNLQCVLCHALINDAVLWKQEVSGRRMCDACLMAMISDGGGSTWIENRINKAVISNGPYELVGPWKRSKVKNQRVTLADQQQQEIVATVEKVKPKRKRKVKEDIVEAVFRELEG